MKVRLGDLPHLAEFVLESESGLLRKGTVREVNLGHPGVTVARFVAANGNDFHLMLGKDTMVEVGELFYLAQLVKEVSQ